MRIGDAPRLVVRAVELELLEEQVVLDEAHRSWLGGKRAVGREATEAGKTQAEDRAELLLLVVRVRAEPGPHGDVERQMFEVAEGLEDGEEDLQGAAVRVLDRHEVEADDERRAARDRTYRLAEAVDGGVEVEGDGAIELRFGFMAEGTRYSGEHRESRFICDVT